jgi:hypothetical protein
MAGQRSIPIIGFSYPYKYNGREMHCIPELVEMTTAHFDVLFIVL